MTVNEIYAKLIQHMTKGIMVHEQLAEYYDFLGLKGYKRCHEYHFFEEVISLRRTQRYFINHHGMLIPELPVENPKIIPESWYKYTRNDVDISTKRNAIKAGIDEWKSWEGSTKVLYQALFRELTSLGEIASADYINHLIKDVDIELKEVDRKYLDLKSIDYDLNVIVPEQQCVHDMYKDKTEHICIKP